MTTPDPNTAAADLEKARAQYAQTANAMRDHLNAVRQQIEAIDLSGLDRLAAELDATTGDSQAASGASGDATTTGTDGEAAAASPANAAAAASQKDSASASGKTASSGSASSGSTSSSSSK
jgi:hypothetical protein